MSKVWLKYRDYAYKKGQLMPRSTLCMWARLRSKLDSHQKDCLCCASGGHCISLRALRLKERDIAYVLISMALHIERTHEKRCDGNMLEDDDESGVPWDAILAQGDDRE